MRVYSCTDCCSVWQQNRNIIIVFSFCVDNLDDNGEMSEYWNPASESTKQTESKPNNSSPIKSDLTILNPNPSSNKQKGNPNHARINDCPETHAPLYNETMMAQWWIEQTDVCALIRLIWFASHKPLPFLHVAPKAP
jgi:hypothetical protein